MPTARLDTGVYSFREAARLTRLRPGRVQSWFMPSARRAGPPPEPVLTSDYDPVDCGRAISFLNLVDVFVFGQLREHGVSLHTLRRVYHRLQADLAQRHPFAHNRLATDGREVFLRVADAEGRDELIEVLNKQRVMVQVIDPFLKQLDYDPGTHLARRWRIAEGVVLNPSLSLGKPVVESVAIRTEVLAAAFYANDKDAEIVARWYNATPDDVLAAVRFEQSTAA